MLPLSPPRARLLTGLLVLALMLGWGGCANDPEPPRPAAPAESAPSPPAAPSAEDPEPEGPAASPEQPVGPARPADPVAALNDALHALDQLVLTLETVRDPISAWNEAANVAQLMQDLEAGRTRYALALTPAEAAARYPDQMQRLARLTEHYEGELRRIQQDPAAWQVLLEEINEAEEEAASR